MDLSNALTNISQAFCTTPPPALGSVVQGITQTEALDRISALYQRIQAQAQRMGDVYGAQVPCIVQANYNAAVNEYYRAATQVFSEILASDPQAQIVQRLYDGNGNITGEKLGGRPVIPTLFPPGNCPDTRPAAPSLNGFGNPLAPIVVRIVIALIVGGTVVVTATQVMRHWPGSAVDAAEARLIWGNAQMDCIVRLQREQNLSAEEAKARCLSHFGEKPPVASSSLGLTIALVGGALVTGALIYVLVSDKRRGKADDTET